MSGMNRSYLSIGRTWMLAIVFILSQPFLSHSQQLKKEIDKIIRYEVDIDFAAVPTLVVFTFDPHSFSIDTFGQSLTDSNRYFFELGSLQVLVGFDHTDLIQHNNQRVARIKLTFLCGKIAAARVNVVVVVITFAEHQPVNFEQVFRRVICFKIYIAVLVCIPVDDHAMERSHHRMYRN